MKLLILFQIIILLMSTHAFAQQEAGKVIFSSGINKVTNANGKSRVVKRGDTVRSGDRLQTTTGRMQVRFTDKGFVSIKPRSELLIQEYKFSGKQDGKENAIFNLIKGSVRAVSGLIGRNNKKAYQYRTPVATIGIRGTAFVLSYCNGDCFNPDGSVIPDGLYVNNGEGKVILTSAGGSIDLVRGQFAYVRDERSAPTQLRQPPAILEQFRNGNRTRGVEESLDQGDERTIVRNTQLRSGFAVQNYNSPESESRANVYGTEYNTRVRPLQGDLSNISGETILLLEQATNNANLNRMIGYAQQYSFFDINRNQQVTYEEFFTTTDNAQGVFGGNGQYNVIWGTWETGWQNSQVLRGEDGNIIPDDSSTNNAQNDFLFHYILSNNLTPVGADGRYEGLNTRMRFGSNTEATLGGQVAYFNTNMTSGTQAIYGNQRVFLDVDFGDGVIHAFNADAVFSSNGNTLGGITASLDNSNGTQSIYTESSIQIQGNCTTGLCGSNGLTGNGEATVDFVGNGAQAAIGTYGLTFIDSATAVNHIVGGSYLIERNQTSSQSSTGIQGIAVASAGLDVAGSSLQSLSLSANSSDNSLAAVSVDTSGANVALESFNNDQTVPTRGGDGVFAFDARTTNPNFTTPATVQVPATSQGNDPNLIVSWGFWEGDYSFTQDGTERYAGTTYPLHFVYTDNITPDSTLSALNSANAVITYDNPIGGTASYQNGSLNTAQIGNVTNSTMIVDFGAGNINSFNLTTDFAGTTDTINLQGQGLGFAARSFDVVTGSPCNICQFTTGPANGSVNYEFVGPNADGVIGSFSVQDPGQSESITGTFVIGQNIAATAQ